MNKRQRKKTLRRRLEKAYRHAMPEITKALTRAVVEAIKKETR